MNYRKYRTAAKTIFSLTFLFALIAAGVYCTLAYFDFTKEIPFEWEYLAVLGGVVAIAAFLAFWLFCISCVVKKRELAPKIDPVEEKVMDACAEHSVEPLYIQAPPMALHHSASFCADCANGRKKQTVRVELDPKQMKTVAMIAVPTAAITAGVAVAMVAKAHKKQKIKRILRDLERALGCRK